MPRVNRSFFESGTFHIMVQGLNKNYIFENGYFKNTYLKLIKKYKQIYDVDIIAYCIMDNHAHLIIHTKDMEEISKYMHDINSVFSRVYNEKIKRVSYVFRDRFKSQNIYSQDYLLKCIKYIHMNPVKAKIVQNEKDYYFSSYNDYFIKNIDKEKIITNTFLNEEEIQILKNMEEKEVEIMDVDRTDDENLEIAIKQMIHNQHITFNEIKKDKKIIVELTSKLKKKGYKQKDIANKLKINEKKISRILRSAK